MASPCSEINLAAQTGYTYEKTEDLLKVFDKHVREARKAHRPASSGIGVSHLHW